MFAGEINDYLVRMNEWLKNQIEEERAENRKLREELEKLRNKIDRISAGLPLEYYQVADGDVNPVNLNDPLKNLK
jgi:regulator of replication initiation timing